MGLAEYTILVVDGEELISQSKICYEVCKVTR